MTEEGAGTSAFRFIGRDGCEGDVEPAKDPDGCAGRRKRDGRMGWQSHTYVVREERYQGEAFNGKI